MSSEAASAEASDAPAHPQSRLLPLALTALGVVYGDIGTSPLYALRECFHGEHAVAPTPDNILGVLSLIFWSLTVVISIKYLGYVMRADNRGEGGILALMALATSTGKLKRYTRATVLLLGLFGAALLYGDGMITPAISVLSAVEGLGSSPSMQHLVIPITIGILIALFAMQSRGTAGVGAIFGPVTLLWFIVLAVLGVRELITNPRVLFALYPGYALKFLFHESGHGFLTLGAVFLVVTGGEALYADMGHFGAKPIRLVWFSVVLPALLLNYFGQGALLLRRPELAHDVFYAMAPSWALYPLIGLATCATVIASQAVISGAFSLTRQASMLGFWPRVRILHTSAKEIGQIYVPSINWVLMLATIGLVLGFGSSSKLAAAYGIAVTTTMVITTLLAYLVARHRFGWSRLAAGSLTVLFLVLDIAFFGSNLVKVAQGGWFPLAVAAMIFIGMSTWKTGRRMLGEQMQEQIIPLEDFFEIMRVELPTRVPGTAVYLTSSPEGTPPPLMFNLEHNRVVHEQVLLLTVRIHEEARVSEDERVEVSDLGNGFTRLVAHYGFMEEPDIVALIAREDTPTPPLQYTTFFMGRETLLAEHRKGMAKWRKRLFAFMARNALRATAFFNVPPDRVMELGVQLRL
ncbi:MAG: potassium transporter Kup [Polyangiaceae bacterium]|nr:potassium transporter Kup [Polyangiaceae bacterium]